MASRIGVGPARFEQRRTAPAGQRQLGIEQEGRGNGVGRGLVCETVGVGDRDATGRGDREDLDSQIDGKRVVITGASRGLGRLLACAFSQSGARVALVARTEADLKAVADELPGPSLVLAGEVTDEDFNEAVADATVAEWGGVDVWICNAGISPIVAGPRKTDPSVWREILDVNLTGAFLGARAAARVMGEGGRLIFTGSVLGERPREGLARVQRVEGGPRRLGQGRSRSISRPRASP